MIKKDGYEEYIEALDKKCPHIRTKSAGDESWDFCDLTERPSGRIKPCLLMSGDKCTEYNEILEEWAKE